DVVLPDEGGPRPVARAGGAVLPRPGLLPRLGLLRVGRPVVGPQRFVAGQPFRVNLRHGLAPRRPARPGLGGPSGPGALVGGQVALPGRVADLEADGLRLANELDAVEGEPVRGVILAGRLREGGGELLVVERGLAGAGLGVDENELPGAAGQVVAVPEAR